MNNLISTLKDGKEEFFAILWKRMGEQGDFPSLSKSVHDLTETIHDEEKSITDITGALLSDFTLTQKVIRRIVKKRLFVRSCTTWAGCCWCFIFPMSGWRYKKFP